MSINLHLGDCLEAMRAMPDNSYDLAIVDPPYGIGFGNYNRTKADKAGKRHKQKNWDEAIPKKEYFEELRRVSKNQIVWGGNYFPPLWDNGCKGFIFWYKGNPVPNFADGELAWSSFNKVAKQFDYRYYGGLEGNTSASFKIHPTQKPVRLYEWLLDNYAKEGDRILDTHLGSGSIALACHNRGYSLDAYEIDKEYYNAAKERLRVQQSQLTIF
jgi:site-specific DNA-methyltransferase (adenine-specific)